MRFGIFGDVHGNLEALEAVLSAMKDLEVDEYLCLGDIVGYGANPEECVQRVRGLGALAIAGNHDHAAIGAQNLANFNRQARDAMLWTRDHISAGTRDWLRSLSLVECLDGFTIVHGSMHYPEAFNYVQTTRDAQHNFERMPQPLLFLGHSHFPFAFFNTDPMTYTLDEVVPVNPSLWTVVNVGSVGQPRDEDPRAGFTVYDNRTGEARLHRTSYPVDQTMEKIMKAGLPHESALRLEKGR